MPNPNDMKKYLLGAVILLPAILAIYLASRSTAKTQELSEAQFTAKLQSNLIAKCRISYPPKPPLLLQDVRGTFYETDSSGRILLENGARKELRFHACFRISDDLTRKLLATTNYEVVTISPAGQELKKLLSRSN